MSRFRYRFVLYQIYVHYAFNCNLNWRELSVAANVSTRTLQKYFGSTKKLSETLIDYHLAYLDHFYTAYRVERRDDMDEQFKLVSTLIKRKQSSYQFTENASRTNLAGRGEEVKEAHLNYIRKAMLHGGVNQKKLYPEMVFNFFLIPIPEGEQGKQLLFHWMGWFMK
jgi:AcrR family transcriptional regulator